MYQEPCCIERTLPQLLKQSPLCVWQTNGDVTFEKIVKAVSYLAGNEIAITLMLPEIDVSMLRVVSWLHARGWLQSVDVLTKKDQSELVNNELSAMDDKHAYFHSRVEESMLVINGEKNIVIVQGWLGSQVMAAHRQYVSYCGNDTSVIDSFIGTLNTLLNRAKSNTKRKQTKQQKDGSTDL